MKERTNLEEQIDNTNINATGMGERGRAGRMMKYCSNTLLLLSASTLYSHFVNCPCIKEKLRGPSYLRTSVLITRVYHYT